MKPCCARLALFVCLIGSTAIVTAQTVSVAGAGANAAESSSQPASVVPQLVKFAGTLTGLNGSPLTGIVGVTFSLYKDQQGGAPLWLETQNVRADGNGHYSVMLGSTTAEGLPADVFSSGDARWLGVQPAGQPEQARVMLLSVPYALKAGDAQTLGGLPASAFMLSVPSASAQISAPAAANGSSTPPPGSPVDVTTTGGAINSLPLFTTANNIQSSILTQVGAGAAGKIGINTAAPGATLDVNGTANVRGSLTLPATGTAAAAAGKNSQPQDFIASVFNSTTSTAVPQKFQWQAQPINNNTANASGTLNLLYASGVAAPAQTGLSINNKGVLNFAAGQVFPIPGAGVTNAMLAHSSLTVTAGTDLTGGGLVALGGATTLNVDTTKVPQLGTANKFVGTQTITGNLALPNTNSAGTQGIISIGGRFIHNYGPVGSYNGFFGYNAGNLTTTGSFLTGTGTVALGANTTGSNNTADGYLALSANTTGSGNTALGYQTLYANTTSVGNTAVGAGALYNGGAGLNTAVGQGALQNGGLGLNTALGATTMAGNTSGARNTATGSGALYANTTGSLNTASGLSALEENTTGGNNTAIGSISLNYNSTGTWNTALGSYAGFSSAAITGSGNTFLGANSFAASGTLSNATAIGYLSEVSANNALVLGSIKGVNSATASTNVGIGTTAPISPLHIAASAASALGPILTLMNTAGGAGAGGSIDFDGYSNTSANPPAARVQSLDDGQYSAHLTFSSKAPGAIGNVLTERMRLTDAGNLGIGSSAPPAKLTISGSESTTNGLGAGIQLTNTASGGMDYYFRVGATGTNTSAGSLSISNDDEYIMTFTTGGNVGIQTQSPSNIFTIQQSLGSALADGWATYSSRRWKTNIHPLSGALAKVERLQGVSYDLKATGKHEIGVIAEEVGKVVPEVVTYEENGKDARSVDYSRLTALLIEAVKQQQKQIGAEAKQIAAQQREIAREQRLVSAEQHQIAGLNRKIGALEVSIQAGAGHSSQLLASSEP
jgi:hypothetical protein